MNTPNHGRVRFGLFEFETSTGELRRDGLPVKLQPQPAQVLACLVSRPAEVVSREELRQAVWGEDTFVDFERNLNFCVAQVRSALGDSSDSPRYIKTLPKRGYQFIAPVETLGMPSAEQPAVTTRGRKRKAVLLALLAAVVVALALLMLTPKVQTDPNRLAIARFDNLTGDPTFDQFTDALTSAVIGDLTSALGSRFGVIGNAAILKRPKTERDLLSIHRDLQANAVVLGEVQRSNGEIHLFAQLITLPDQRHAKALRIQTTGSDPVQAQSELARRTVESFLPSLTTLSK